MEDACHFGEGIHDGGMALAILPVQRVHGGDKMKKLLVLAALVAVAFTPAAAQAGPLGPDNVVVGDIITVADYNNTNIGGPFSVNNLTPFSPDGWLTFCVEVQETLAFGRLLEVVGISDTAYNGGVGPEGDPLDPETAYLYTQYRQMGGSTNATLNNDYQNAIWWIEEAPGGVNNYLVAAAFEAVNSGSWVGLGNVRVMNLVWGQDYGNFKKGDRAQDLLTMVGVPDGGATLTLLGCALLGLGALRRKFNA